MSTNTLIHPDAMASEDLSSPQGMMLRVGDRFPQFSLTAVVNNDPKEAFKVISNEDYKGKWLILFAWPEDFTFVCPTELAEFNRLYDEFQDRDAQILGFSIDNKHSHLAWRQSHQDLKDLKYPMLSDVKRELSWQCGILHEEKGVAQRAVFIVDPESTVQFSMMTSTKVGRNPTEILRVLDALQTEGLCACGWESGDANL